MVWKRTWRPSCGGSVSSEIAWMLRSRRSADAIIRKARASASVVAEAGMRTTIRGSGPAPREDHRQLDPVLGGQHPDVPVDHPRPRGARPSLDGAEHGQAGSLLEIAEALEAARERVDRQDGRGEADEANDARERGEQTTPWSRRLIGRNRRVQHPGIGRDQLLLRGDLVQPSRSTT